MRRRRILILGAGGRDFHNFNLLYRHRQDCEVLAFTASQIPFQQGRVYPAVLAGALYPDGIPIIGEEPFGELVRRLAIDEAVFSFSDVSHQRLMEIASPILATPCDFRLVGAEHTMLKASLPVISVCAVRTGCGKSPVTRYICRHLLEAGQRPVVVRHPMAYGRLEHRAVQSFRHLDDLDAHQCTLEEREEYEPLLRLGVPLLAGIDYEAVLRAAEPAGNILIWDGGNNDTPFFFPDLDIVLVDPFRAGDELSYYPGYVNLRRAHLIVVSKRSEVPEANLDRLRRNLQSSVPETPLVQGDLQVSVASPEALAGCRVLVVEDGPTISHGGMAFGAGVVAARRFGAGEIVDPRPYAVGSLARVYAEYPHIGAVVPAMGYSAAQLDDLRQTLAAVPCDLVLSATPVDLARLLVIDRPVLRVSYEFCDASSGTLRSAVNAMLHRFGITSANR
ncbi:MAG: GTPase [Syntrophotalea sp.]|uniref:GTPase n=1 Tax=Syntrophotalea sp. TaxID=2812029 RepID=UPI003D10E4CA